MNTCFLLISWLPIVVAILCLIFTGLGLTDTREQQARRIMVSAIYYYLIIGGSFTSWLFYLWWPQAYVAAVPLCYFCMSFSTVFLYRLVCELTLKHFPETHYILPVSLTLVMSVWATTVPFDVKLNIVQNLGEHHSAYPLFSFFFTSILITQTVFNTIYAILSVRNFRLFQKEVSPNIKPSVLTWLKIVLSLICTSVLVPVIALIIGKNTGGILQVSLSIILFSFVCLLLTINILKGNYPRQPVRKIRNPEENSVNIPIKKHQRRINPKSRIDKEELLVFKNTLNIYFREKKPYRNPRLKMEDVAGEMGYTRNRFSALVNQASKVNFNTLVNSWRLKELARIEKTPENRSLSRAQQVKMAGFGSYDSYLRAEREIDLSKTRKKKKIESGKEGHTLTGMQHEQ